VQIHDVIQRTPAWEALRDSCWPGSVAPAMRGESSYVMRDEAIAAAAVGTPREFSAWVEKNILQKGRDIEIAGRRIAEKMLGEDLYPATCTEDIPGLSRPLLVSLDGLTMDWDTTFECKQYNAGLFAAVQGGDCLEHRFQVVQGLVITKAKRCLFMCTDGTEENTATCWITLRDGDERDLIAGWKQFEEDVKNYTPPPQAEVVVGATIKELPALTIRVEGRVVDSNLGVFRQAARELIAAIRTDLQTDQDFADADKATKWLKDGEDRLELVKAQALSQTATIDDLFRTVDEIRNGMRDKRLMLEKLVKTRKEGIRAEIVTGARTALGYHCLTLSNLLAGAAKNWWPRGVAAPTITVEGVGENFVGVIKGLKSIDSLRNKVNTELADRKIAASSLANAIQERMALMAELAPQHAHLFTDASQLVNKDLDYVKLAVEGRLRDEQRRIEAEEARKKAEAAAAAATAAAIATAQQPPAAVHPAEAGLREQQPASVPTSADPASSQLATSQAVGAAAGINVTNKFLVGVRGDNTLVIAKLRPDYLLTKANALNLAAWLVALADDNDEFPALLRAIQNT
jgi:predicted phage-related endonuclease